MTGNERDPLDVPVDQVMTRDGGGDPKGGEPKDETEQATRTGASKIEGSHAQETVHPAERLPDDPEDQNDLA